MDQLKANLPHMVIALAVITAAVVLMALNKLTSTEGVTLIAAAGGFSLGAGAGSASASLVAPTVSVTSHSNGEQTATVTPSPSGPVAPATVITP